jgi:DNA helicase TIP49 (TBP-interacting protein)
LRCISGTLSRNNQNRQEQITVNNSNSHSLTTNDVSNLRVSPNISTIITNSSSHSVAKNPNRCHQTKTSLTNRTQLSISQVPVSRNPMENLSTPDVNNLSLVSVEKNVTHKLILQNMSTKQQQHQKEADDEDRVTILQGTVSKMKKNNESVQLNNEQTMESNDRNLITVVTVTGCLENSNFHNSDQSLNQKMEIIAHL